MCSGCNACGNNTKFGKGNNRATPEKSARDSYCSLIPQVPDSAATLLLWGQTFLSAIAPADRKVCPTAKAVQQLLFFFVPICRWVRPAFGRRVQRHDWRQFQLRFDAAVRILR